MLKNYFKIAWRNLLRHKAFSFINVFGLAFGMACSIMILLWVQDELSYDRFHTHIDQLYRITGSTPDGKIKAATTSAPLGAALKFQLPEVKNTVRLRSSANLFETGNRKFEESRVFYVDTTFLELFSFPLLKGNSKTALSRPDGVLLTEEMAKKYFGEEEALGKRIRMDNQDNFTVTGILANVPANSHLQFDFILPIAFLARTNDDLKNNRWGRFNFYTYVQLDKNVVTSPASLQKLNQRINQIYKANETRIKINLRLQPVSSIHLNSNLLRDLPGNGNIQYVHIFSIVALFILLVACINFMNLATARSARRAKEVGLRKVVGATRTQLIFQFLSESTLISFLALLLATVILWALLPVFNDLANKKLSIHLLDRGFVFKLLGIALVTGVFSGSYPALFLSGFKAAKALKGNMKAGGGNVLFRNGLIVTQFVASIILLVGTVVVYNQLQFIKNKNLGFDKENLVYVNMTGDLWGHQEALKSELKQNSLTRNYTITQELPTNIITGAIDVEWESKDPQAQFVFPTMAVDENFITVFKMKMLSGRSFSKEFKEDTTNYVVNEKALQVMVMDAINAVGKPLTLNGRKGILIGVVKDFNFKPVQQGIEPLILFLNTWGGKIVVRTTPGNTKATIKALEKTCQKLNPAYPFAYSFIDEDLANLYKNEQRMGDVFNLFAILSIFIACLGLYGLSAFIAEQRAKEIGVRKVLGGSVFHIVYLLSGSFTRPILIAMIIAAPLSWVIMNNWLDDFAYRINLHWSVFLIVFLTTLLIAWLTVSYESLKAAIANPVKSLRTE